MRCESPVLRRGREAEHLRGALSALPSASGSLAPGAEPRPAMSSKSGDDVVHIELPDDKEPVRDTLKDRSQTSLAQSNMKERLSGKNSFITAGE